MTHLVVIGAGMAGLPCAIRAADAGAQVTLIESADNVGGKLPRSSGQISAAGTRLQAEKGIIDSADDHFADVMRICHETADPNVVRLAVNHAAATVDWLQDIGVPFPPDHPVISYNHDVYRRAVISGRLRRANRSWPRCVRYWQHISKPGELTCTSTRR